MEQKTASRRQKWKPVFESYLMSAESNGAFDRRFGIYVKSYVSREFFVSLSFYYGELGSKSCFWQKSCFFCSQAAASVPDQTDPGFWFAIVESTPDWMESCFFWSYVHHSLPFLLWVFSVCCPSVVDCNGAKADESCCSDASPCGVNEGDCDWDSECEVK